MWDSIVACTPKILPVIPCGAAIQRGRETELGDTFCRDGYHLNYEYEPKNGIKDTLTRCQPIMQY
jgi:hypothetical protein